MKYLYLSAIMLLLSATSCKKYYCRVCNNGNVALDQFQADPCGDGSNNYKMFTVSSARFPYENNSHCIPQ
ncbi:MAG TPA: hypothetical protein VK154_08580 [Chitinophagales bacterium]|nr:hypothetical protein [Chitinophagales bacterium]